MGAKRIIAVDGIGYRLERARFYGVEALNFKDYDNTGQELKEITHGVGLPENHSFRTLQIRLLYQKRTKLEFIRHESL